MDYINYILTILFALSIIFNFIQSSSKQRSKLLILEAKVQYIYETTGITFEPSTFLAPAIRKAVEGGKKIEAIKLYRDATGSSLKEAKDAVEKIVPRPLD